MNATNSINPFPGLRPFHPDEDYLFFGREEQTMELLQRLGDNRFVAVVGTSGSGKSSLVRCGLLSELLGGKLLRAGAAWEIAVTHPGGDPLALLADALLEADLYDPDEEDAQERLLATLTRSHFGLVEAVKQAGLSSGTNFLLVVDQFEEIFRFHEAGQTQQEAANEFVSLLLQAIQQQEIPIYVVITMRSDFIGECSQFEGLSEMVNRGEFLIPRLTREQYKRVIEAPIKVAGGKITPRLLQRLLNDLGQQADQLPCLQHALMRTWIVSRDQDASKALDLDDYQSVGRMSQALSLHADEVYESLSSDRQREICAGIFQALTVQESDNRGVRRPQQLRNLSKILDLPAADLLPVIDAYRQHGITFLMPPPEVELNESTIIDISHESLMRVWTRLRRWAEEESQAAGIYKRLSESAVMHEQGEAGLYRDPELGIALSWRATCKPNEAWAARYHQDFARAIEFLDKSESAAQVAEREQVAAHQRELDQARELADAQRLRAEEQKRAASWLKRLVAGLTAVAAVAIVASVLAASARKAATENERRAVEEHREAVRAGEATQLALEDAQSARDEAQGARDEAERAGEEERRQRQVAETQTTNARKSQRQLEVALSEAEVARKDAESASSLAESSRQRAEDERSRAEMAEQRAVADRQVAEREKVLAERNAELARRREQLFEELLPLLREHAADGIGQYAERLQREGKPRAALDTFADFCNLVLGEHRGGFLARELLDLDSFDLQGLDTEVVATEISVPPLPMFSNVVMPAIDLAERLLADQADNELPQLVSLLHSYRVRLLKQYPDEEWPVDESAAMMIFDSLDRRAALEPGRYERFLERAGARFRLPAPDLTLALEDLNRAIELFPDAPDPHDDSRTTDKDHQFAQIQHARANVLEYMALKSRAENSGQLLSAAADSHRIARLLDPQNSNYAVGVARALRKRNSGVSVAQRSREELALAEKALMETLEADAEHPGAYNELGELRIATDQIVESRAAFEKAVAYAKQSGHERALYIYYCNLANSYTRDPTDQAGYTKALEAAEKAIAAGTGSAVEGHYYRGFALWKQGRIADALQALAAVTESAPRHVEASLARCQIIFEMRDPNPATAEQLNDAYAEIRNVLEYPDLTGEAYAKACYVNSLGWLRNHVQQRTEQALVNCLEFAFKATQRSRAYYTFAQQIFQYAAQRAWSDTELQQQSAGWQQEFGRLPANAAAN